MIDICNNIIHDKDFDTANINSEIASAISRLAVYDLRWANAQFCFFANAHKASKNRKTTMVEACLSVHEAIQKKSQHDALTGNLEALFNASGEINVIGETYSLVDNGLKKLEPALEKRLKIQWEKAVTHLTAEDEMLALTHIMGSLSLIAPISFREISLQKWKDTMNDLYNRDPDRAREIARKTIREIGSISSPLQQYSKLILKM